MYKSSCVLTAHCFDELLGWPCCCWLIFWYSATILLGWPCCRSVAAAAKDPFASATTLDPLDIVCTYAART